MKETATASTGYTLADLRGDPLFKLFSGEVTLRVRQAKGVRNIVVTPENSEWCFKHFGKYEIAPAGIYPFCQGVDLEEDGIGLPTTYAHLSFAVDLVKPAPGSEGEEGGDEDER